jgi:hypothetical protein
VDRKEGPNQEPKKPALNTLPKEPTLQARDPDQPSIKQKLVLVRLNPENTLKRDILDTDTFASILATGIAIASKDAP